MTSYPQAQHEGGREYKKRRESSVEEPSESNREGSRTQSKSSASVSRNHSRRHLKGHQGREKSYSEKDSGRSDRKGDRLRSEERRGNSHGGYHEKGRDGGRRDIDKRDVGESSRNRVKSWTDQKTSQAGRRESDKFGQMLSKEGEKSALKRYNSQTHRTSCSPVRYAEDNRGGDVKVVNKVKLSHPVQRRSSQGEQDKITVSRGSVKEHDNWNGPECPKCAQVCKNKEGLRNHVLSHYYEVFFEVGVGLH